MKIRIKRRLTFFEPIFEGIRVIGSTNKIERR